MLHDCSPWVAGYYSVNRNSSSLGDQVLRPLSCGCNCRSLRKHRPSIVNQALQPVGCHIQCRVIHRALVATGGFGALRLENVVNFFFDI
jgi:hypothetical protein